MAVPGSPSVGSRALYFPFAVPAPTLLSAGQQGTTNYPTAPASGGYTQPVPSSVLPPDIGSPGVGLPAIVLSVAGSAPDYSGLLLAVHLPTALVTRSAGFTSNQPMLNVMTWTTNGSNPLQCRWQHGCLSVRIE
jgi:hypothetical protein